MSAQAVLVSSALPVAIVDEIQRACDAIGVAAGATSDLRTATVTRDTVAIVAALPAGERRIPADVIAAAERGSGVRILLCSTEPMLRPTASLHDGRVVIVSAPFDRRRLIGCMRQVTGRPVPGDLDGARGQHGEMLRADWWLAWARHPAHRAMIDRRETASGLTVTVHGVARGPIAERVAELMGDSHSDREREAALRDLVGDGAVVHLSPTRGEWLVYWPEPRHALWLCSSWRIPARWSIAAAGAQDPQRLVKLPAYPGDVVLGATATEGNPALERALAALAGGAPDAYAVLREACARDPGLLAVVVEVR